MNVIDFHRKSYAMVALDQGLISNISMVVGPIGSNYVLCGCHKTRKFQFMLNITDIVKIEGVFKNKKFQIKNFTNFQVIGGWNDHSESFKWGVKIIEELKKNDVDIKDVNVDHFLKKKHLTAKEKERFFFGGVLDCKTGKFSFFEKIDAIVKTFINQQNIKLKEKEEKYKKELFKIFSKKLFDKLSKEQQSIMVAKFLMGKEFPLEIAFMKDKKNIKKEDFNEKNFEILKICKNSKCENSEREKHLKACGRCMKVFYCSRECQKIDWKKHKEKCKKRKMESFCCKYEFIDGGPVRISHCYFCNGEIKEVTICKCHQAYYCSIGCKEKDLKSHEKDCKKRSSKIFGDGIKGNFLKKHVEFIEKINRYLLPKECTQKFRFQKQLPKNSSLTETNVINFIINAKEIEKGNGAGFAEGKIIRFKNFEEMKKKIFFDKKIDDEFLIKILKDSYNVKEKRFILFATSLYSVKNLKERIEILKSILKKYSFVSFEIEDFSYRDNRDINIEKKIEEIYKSYKNPIFIKERRIVPYSFLFIMLGIFMMEDAKEYGQKKDTCNFYIKSLHGYEMFLTGIALLKMREREHENPFFIRRVEEIIDTDKQQIKIAIQKPSFRVFNKFTKLFCLVCPLKEFQLFHKMFDVFMGRFAKNLKVFMQEDVIQRLDFVPRYLPNRENDLKGPRDRLKSRKKVLNKFIKMVENRL